MSPSEGISFKIDTSELVTYSKNVVKVSKAMSPVMVASLNSVGDDLVSLLAINLSRQTGLHLEQVRGLMKVRRATRGRLSYELGVPHSLLAEPESRRLEGKKEKGFGPFKPGQLVIVVTQDDELVCMDCEELGAAGPMPAETAMAHIPKHPNCRCVILPYVQRGKRMPVSMTSLSGTDSVRRAGGTDIDANKTLRQLAQDILNRTSREIKVQLR
jgi:hypothetical protein